MIVSVCPTFFCNQRCQYCYLGAERSNRACIDLDMLDQRLTEIDLRYGIDAINVFGGEIGLLDTEYLAKLRDACSKFSSHITANTNLSTHRVFDVFDDVSISLNHERPDFARVWNEIPSASCKFAVSTVVLPALLKLSDNELLEFMQHLDNTQCTALTFQRYSPPRKASLRYNISQDEFEHFIMRVFEICSAHVFSYPVTNFADLDMCIAGIFRPTIDANIFINPSGQYGAIQFDDVGHEYFSWVDSLDAIDALINEELSVYHERCCSCEFFGRCYAEHLNFAHQCSGCQQLLHWWETNRGGYNVRN